MNEQIDYYGTLAEAIEHVAEDASNIRVEVSRSSPDEIYSNAQMINRAQADSIKFVGYLGSSMLDDLDKVIASTQGTYAAPRWHAMDYSRTVETEIDPGNPTHNPANGGKNR